MSADNLLVLVVVCEWCAIGTHGYCKDRERVSQQPPAGELRFERHLCPCPHAPGLPPRDRLGGGSER